MGALSLGGKEQGGEGIKGGKLTKSRSKNPSAPQKKKKKRAPRWPSVCGANQHGKRGFRTATGGHLGVCTGGWRGPAGVYR